MSSGYFLSGLLNGAQQGLNIGRQVRGLIDDSEVRDLREKGMAEAQAQRDADVADAVKMKGGTPVADATSTEASTGGQTGTVAPDTSTAQVGDTSVPAPDSVQSTPMPMTDASGNPVAPSQAGQAPAGQTASTNMAANGLLGTTASANPAMGNSATSGLLTTPGQASNQAVPGNTQSAASPAPETSSPNLWSYGGKDYTNQNDAIKAAQDHLPTVLQRFNKNMVPQIQQKLLEQGNIEKADAWGKYAASAEGQDNIKNWAKLYNAATLNDWETAGEKAMSLYKNLNDGVTPLSHEVVKDKNGNVTGFNVKLQNDTTGERITNFIPKDKIVQLGLTALSPQALFETTFAQQNAADKTRAEGSIKATAAQQNQVYALQRDQYAAQNKAAAAAADRAGRTADIAQRGQIDASNKTNQYQDKYDAKIATLKRLGKSDADIAKMADKIVDDGEYKKTTAPNERRALIASDLQKDVMSGFNGKTQAEQQAMIDQRYRAIYTDGEDATSGNMAAGGLPPMKTVRNLTIPQMQGVKTFDPATGKMITH